MNILIIGGSSWLGKKLALTFAASATNIILLSRSKDKLTSVAGELEGMTKVHLIVCDLAKIELIERAVEQVESQFTSIDLILNVAGGSYVGGTNECSADDFFLMIDSYIKGQIFLIKKLIPLMRRSPNILLVNFLADWVTRKAGMECGNAIYTMTKAALGIFADCLVSEEHRFGLRVSNIYLGQISEADLLVDLERDNKGVADLLFMQDICDFVKHFVKSESLHITDVIIGPKSASYARTRIHTNSPKHDI